MTEERTAPQPANPSRKSEQSEEICQNASCRLSTDDCRRLTVTFQRLNECAQLPRYAHPGDAGLDLAASEACTLEPGAWAAVPTGLKVCLPPGTEAQVRPRSGLAARFGVTVLNAPGTIDEGYRGELKVLLINHGRAAFHIEPGMRIAQLVVAPVLRVEPVEGEVDEATTRGTGGFGSSGMESIVDSGQ